jgi:predicted RNase H-like HicB family nuclease
MSILKISIEFWKEGNLYIARSPELDMVAQGNSLEGAKKNLLEVIQIQFEEMKELGTLDEFLLEAGYLVKEGIAESKKEIISFDKSFVKLELAS